MTPVLGRAGHVESVGDSRGVKRRGWTPLKQGQRGQRLALWKLDRTDRIAYQILEWLGHLRTLGVRLVSHEDSVDELSSAGANGRIVSGIKAMFAEIETDTMSVRQLASKAQLAEAG